MNDQTIPANLTRKEARAVREWAERAWNTKVQDATVAHAARVLLAVLPKRPTLADMTLDERDECVGMQADLAQGDRVVILDGTPDAAGLVQVLEKSLDVYRAYPAEVTPRPDLSRLEWPGNEKPAPAPALPDGWRLADHPQYGPVVVTSMEPDDAGFVWFVRTDPYGGSEGYDAGCCKPDVLTFLAQGADTSDTVPEGTLTVGSVWDDADAMAQACRESESDHIVVVDKRGSVGVWDTGMRCWRVSAPHVDFAPYTIIHTGKKANQ